jgi:hypothetical protein
LALFSLLLLFLPRPLRNSKEQVVAHRVVRPALAVVPLRVVLLQVLPWVGLPLEPLQRLLQRSLRWLWLLPATMMMTPPPPPPRLTNF